MINLQLTKNLQILNSKNFLKLGVGIYLGFVVWNLGFVRETFGAEPTFHIHSLTAALTPNDPRVKDQWHLEKISAPRAWDRRVGRAQEIIAIVDTGVDYNHEDLKDRMWSNPGEVAGNGVDDDQNGKVDDSRGWDFVNNDSDPIDDQNHGTAIAGLAAAATNNATGVAGISWHPKIMNLKALNSAGSGFDSDVTEAINYARMKGAKIINLSFGGGSLSTNLKSAIDEATAAGIVVIASTGNSGLNDMEYPARYEPVVAVGASTRDEQRASFSNAGLELDLLAPSDGVLTTKRGGGYAAVSGTSAAAPQVAGALALLVEEAPDLTVSQLVERLREGAVRLPAMNGERFTREHGYGRLDVYGTLLAESETGRFAAELIANSPLPPSGRYPLQVGQPMSLFVQMKNTGERSWRRGGTAPRVSLGTTGPRDRLSPLLGTTNRAGSHNELVVYPGDIGAFEFSVIGPASPGAYEERLELVAEGVEWSGPTITLPLQVFEHNSAVFAQSGGTAQSPIKIKSGESTRVWVQFKNTGITTWYQGGVNPIRLGTASSRDRLSTFIGSVNRGPTVNESEVKPGQIGAFELLLTASVPPGTYRESFQMVAENSHWFGDTVTFEVVVE